MRLLITDQDSGSLKEVVFPKTANTSDKAAPQPSSVLVYARAGAARHAQSMLRVGEKGQWIMVARKDGSVCLYDASSPAAPAALEEEEQQQEDEEEGEKETEENGEKNKKQDKSTKETKKEKFGCPTLEGSDDRFSLVYEWPANTSIYPKPADAPKYDRGDCVVGMVEEYPGGIVMSLSKEGKLVAYDVIAATMGSSLSAEEKSASSSGSVFSNKTVLGSVRLPGKNYTTIAAHPSQPGVIAVAGKEIELQVYGTDWEKEEEEEEEDSLSKKITPIWAPKNVKKDHLGIASPIWIEKVFFLEDPSRTEPISSVAWAYIGEEEENTEGKKKEYEFKTKISTVTHHGEVRIYDPSVRQRPVKRLTLVPNGEFLGVADVGKVHFNIPVNNESDDKEDKKEEDDEDEELYSSTPLSLLVADRKTSTFVVNIDPADQTNLKMVGKLHGATGAISTFATFAQPLDTTTAANNKDPSAPKSQNETEQYLVTGSLDRFVRVYEANSRKQVAKVFVGTRPTGIVVLDGFETSYGEGYDGETIEKTEKRKQEKEDDEMWSKLGKAEELNVEDEDMEDYEEAEEEEEEVIIEEDESETKNNKRKGNKKSNSGAKAKKQKK